VLDVQFAQLARTQRLLVNHLVPFVLQENSVLKQDNLLNLQLVHLVLPVAHIRHYLVKRLVTLAPHVAQPLEAVL
jgi:hypothetical protein